MSRQFKNGTCSCWKKVDKELAEHETRLEVSFDLGGKEYLSIHTERIPGLNRSRKNRPKRAFATFCPFCGAKLK